MSAGTEQLTRFSEVFPCVEQEHGNNEQPKQQTLVPPQQDFVLQTLVKTANKGSRHETEKIVR